MSALRLLGWDASRRVWLDARRDGIGASDVAALLGFSPWETPWQVWADKTGTWQPNKPVTESMALGTDLEPWLIDQAPKLLNQPVSRTPHMLYAHAEHAWRLCSPDAFAADGSLVEVKTAKLATWGDPDGWDDGGIPLCYELQTRWQMHVMDRARVYVVALVAGMGRITRTIERDLVIEADLVGQVDRWRTTHILGRVEPPIGGDDVATMADRYRKSDGTTTDLDGTDVLEWVTAYKVAHELERAGKEGKQEPKARLQAALGRSTAGTLDGRLMVTWNPTAGDVDWQQMARDLADKTGVEIPDPEQYRKPPGRTLLVK